jgi:Animal haem peroxidase
VGIRTSDLIESRRDQRARPEPTRRRRKPGGRSIVLGIVALMAVIVATITYSDLVVRSDSSPEEIHSRRSQDYLRTLETRPQSLDGSGNNRRHPTWGQAGTNYSRVADANYADGIGAPVEGPDPRYVSNRVFNDVHQNVFSENDVTQWGFVWGQFLDHTFGLRQEDGEQQDLGFDSDDPLEEFTNTLGGMPFARSAAAPGTGETSPREQVNTVSSYIDAWAVYGGSEERLEWLREGPVDGDISNNGALLVLDEDGLLPRRDARGDASTAPDMATDGRLRAAPDSAMVAGDVRANENIALTATHTLFAREHNRIVSELPDSLNEEQKFQIARRVVIAEQQYITYREFLPTLGIRLPRYRGYDPRVDTTLSNEFATVGYRAHSMIHGELEVETGAERYAPEDLAALEEQGVEAEVSEDGSEVEFVVPLNVAFFNPDLVGQLQLGPLLQGIGLEAQYQNDEMIDNQLRSVLFQIPVAGNPECLDGEGLPGCFEGVLDLGAVDIARGRDHGMPSYNDLREAYGLERVASFTEITGEASEEFPADPELTPGDEINDPDSLDFVELRDGDGNVIDPVADPDAAEADVVTAIRRTSMAARLRAIYGAVDNVDAFTGMLAEAHLDGADFGPLQRAIWAEQFRRLRDGDRYFYRNDQTLRWIRDVFGIDYRTNLGDVIARNTDVPRDELGDNVFLVQEEETAPEDPAAPTPEAPADPAASTQQRQPALCPEDQRECRPAGMGS